MNTNDYPAAHSMDTIWFAVDKNGHVGMFTSGEAGAVPLESEAGNCGPHIEYDKLGAVATRQDSTLNLNLRMFMKHPLLLKGKVATWEELPDKIYCLVLRHTTPLKMKHAPDSITTPDGTFSEMYRCDKLDLLKRYDSGEITHIWADTTLIELIGVFEYSQGEKWESWIAGPYERERAPLKPITISDLSPDTYSKPIVLKDSDFTTDLKIQPAESIPCQFWNNEFVSIDERTIRPTSPEVTIDIEKNERARLEKEGFIFGPPISRQKK